jgi:hypothetical protein
VIFQKAVLSKFGVIINSAAISIEAVISLNDFYGRVVAFSLIYSKARAVIFFCQRS